MPSRTTHADAGGAAKDAKNGTAVSKAVANKIVDRAVSRIDDTLLGISFSIVQTYDDIPAPLKVADAIEQGIKDGNLKGAYMGGVVYVVLDRNKSAKDV